MAIRHDNAFRASGAYSLVSARKNGLPPSGSTIGKSATRTRSRFFAASCMVSVTARPECSLTSSRKIEQSVCQFKRPSLCRVAPVKLLVRDLIPWRSQETTGSNAGIPAMTESNTPPYTTAFHSLVQSREQCTSVKCGFACGLRFCGVTAGNLVK